MFSFFFTFNKQRWTFDYFFGSMLWVVSLGGITVGFMRYDIEQYLDEIETELLNAMAAIKRLNKEKEDATEHGS